VAKTYGSKGRKNERKRNNRWRKLKAKHRAEEENHRQYHQSVSHQYRCNITSAAALSRLNRKKAMA